MDEKTPDVNGVAPQEPTDHSTTVAYEYYPGTKQEPEETTSKLKMPTLAQLLASSFGERRYLLSPWLREQESCLLYAETGVGKSMFALSAALAIAGGGEFLGWRPGKRADERAWKVLYVDGEMHITDIQDRAQMLLDAVPEIDRELAGQNLRFLARQHQDANALFPSITERAGMEFILNRVQKGPLDLVVLDNFSTLGEVEDENQASSFNAIQQFLLQLKVQGVATILVHHANKTGEDFRGSSKLAATFETIIKLERLRDRSTHDTAQFRVRWDKVRAGANTGDLTLDIASISVTGTNASDFGETNTCPASLAGGANCIINVTFSPTQEGPLSASVSVNDNSAGSPQSAALNGIGLASGANVSLSPNSLTFPGQLLNTTSASMPVTLSNFGTVAVNLSSIAASANFAEAQSCPANLAPLANCTINVTFTPTAAGNLMGTLTVTDDAPGSPQTIALSGIGAMPTTATLAPNSMEFFCSPLHGEIGGCTPPQHATLTNTGNATLYFYGVTLMSATGYFSTTNNCPTQLEPGQSCIITVSFGAPISRNKTTYSATLVVNDTASNPQQIALTGTASPN